MISKGRFWTSFGVLISAVFTAGISHIARNNRFGFRTYLIPLLGGALLFPWSMNSRAQVACSSPSFSAATNYDVGGSAGHMTVGDFNRDGVPDLAVANATANAVSILLGDEVGGFGPKTDFPSGGGGLIGRGIGDFNHDGKLDLAIGNAQSNTVSILLGDGMGGFGEKTDFPVNRPFMETVADFNLDGNLDLAMTVSVPEWNVAVLLGDGKGSFGPATYYCSYEPTQFTGGRAGIAVGDFNRDGKPDLAAGGGKGTGAPPFTNNMVVLLGDGLGGFGPPAYLTLGQGPQAWAVGDFNDDGVTDIAVKTAPNNMAVLLGDGKGSFSERTLFPAGIGAGPTAADFNRDGKLDLVHPNGPDGTVSVLLGDGKGGFGERVTFSVGGTPQKPEVGDFNRDGKPDIVVPKMAPPGQVSVLLNTCTP
ncbi:MAG: VCBS repeat-containing protein [Acidobacteria bacterium]|nr:VCBS repeat-containing protein [Acidobacteriota bacterium]